MTTGYKKDIALSRHFSTRCNSEAVKRLRKEVYGMTQKAFAEFTGLSVSTIFQIEQGRSPGGPTAILFRILAAEPEACKRALTTAETSEREPNQATLENDSIS